MVDRQAIVVEEAQGGPEEEGGTVELAPGSETEPPEPWEHGFKDTVIAYPEQVTRVRMKFDTPGQYVWHCHIVEHEDDAAVPDRATAGRAAGDGRRGLDLVAFVRAGHFAG